MLFSDFAARLHPLLFKGIPYPRATEVQARTLPAALAGRDIFGRALTGTGKTAAFLVPLLDRMARAAGQPTQLTRALVLSPTRELAMQISTEARKLLAHLPDIKVTCVVGGTNINSDTNRLRSTGADLLVATPGRLIDHLSNNGMGPRFAALETFVLDEADRLLDQGFKRDIEKIIGFLPDRARIPRQTMLFSATVPADVKHVANLALLPDHEFISTISAEDDAATHKHVEQFRLTASLDDLLPMTLAVLRAEAAAAVAQAKPFKAIAFFPTARHTSFAAELLGPGAGKAGGLVPLGGAGNACPIWPIHSRMSQSARTKAAAAFHGAASGILISSDVTARGMDFPNVTHVVQVGLPMSPEQYIHRLGRTGRAGASGKGILILSPFEQPRFLGHPQITALGIQPYPVSQISGENMAAARKAVTAALDTIDNSHKTQVYQAWLGYYNTAKTTLPTDKLIDEANRFAKEILRYVPSPEDRDGLPPLLNKTIGMMGLKAFKNKLNAVAALPPKSTPF